MKHHHLLAFQMCSATIKADVESLEGGRRFGYTEAVRGRQPRGPRPASLAGFSTSDTTNPLPHVVKSGRQGSTRTVDDGT